MRSREQCVAKSVFALGEKPRVAANDALGIAGILPAACAVRDERASDTHQEYNAKRRINRRASRGGGFFPLIIQAASSAAPSARYAPSLIRAIGSEGQLEDYIPRESREDSEEEARDDWPTRG